MSARVAPPRSEHELSTRAQTLIGSTLGELSDACMTHVSTNTLRTKGKAGELLEIMLGADARGLAEPDFRGLGVELKTLPLRANRMPAESTYVCRVPMTEPEHEEWSTSWACRKLSRVLWVGIEDGGDWHDRRVLWTKLWSPAEPDSLLLKADFEEAMSLVALGRYDKLTAHLGTAMQVRPKARDGSERVTVRLDSGEQVTTGPRGFYLRPGFVARCLGLGVTGDTIQHNAP